MRIGIYLTCQGKFFNAILNYLPLGTEIFYEENWVMFSENRMPTHEWLDLDYFIYQPIIEPQKPAYADANILGNYVSASAKKIRVPYLMFTGLTPWRQYADSPQLGTEHRNCWLDKSLAENDNVERAIGETMLRTGLDISSNAEESFEQLRKKESECDISGLSQWIQERFRSEHLFWTPNHPRGTLALAFCNKILDAMSIPSAPPEAAKALDRVLNVERTPLLPGVASSLGIQYQDNIAFFKNDQVRSVSGYLHEYARRLSNLV